MNHGIYKLEWPKQGYYYIGRSENLIQRRATQMTALRSGNHCNSNLQRVFNQYGEFTFTILEYCDKKHLIDRERYYINLNKDINKCCNIHLNKHAEIDKRISNKKLIPVFNSHSTDINILLSALDRQSLERKANEENKTLESYINERIKALARGLRAYQNTIDRKQA